MDGWRLYPEGVDSFNPFECDAAAARQYLIDHEKLIFSESDVSVNIIDASGKQEMSLSLLRDTDSIPDSSRFKADHSSFYKEVDVLRHIKASNPDLRIMYGLLRRKSISADLCQIDLTQTFVVAANGLSRALAQDPDVPRHWARLFGPASSVSRGR